MQQLNSLLKSQRACTVDAVSVEFYPRLCPSPSRLLSNRQSYHYLVITGQRACTVDAVPVEFYPRLCPSPSRLLSNRQTYHYLVITGQRACTVHAVPVEFGNPRDTGRIAVSSLPA
ncbi:hypothetical protein RRG08_032696 [Elysia crispata]|uniref:Uncharacterized protein n=1 Tax=Elysia crispata TaxID=231223 RepID=A0AAE1D5T2_9GAST|nr:hypothetical protein RRG08_032696 [Elysia crispata]